MKRILLLSMLALCLLSINISEAQTTPGEYASPVPRFTFSTDLKEQEKELANNSLLKRFRGSRAELLKDPHYPRYHFSSPENRLNDPNGLSFWNGNWHMFY
ncbi:MAG: hypothetical protein ACJ07L_17700 [Opitutales bacterium]